MLVRTSKNCGDNLDLRRIVGGLLVHWFYTLNDNAASRLRERYETQAVSGAPW